MADDKIKIPDPIWKCSNCGNTLQNTKPPEECPVCHHRCEFLNVTCYTPDCEFSGTDPRLK
jgi:rubrerythrin